MWLILATDLKSSRLKLIFMFSILPKDGRTAWERNDSAKANELTTCLSLSTDEGLGRSIRGRKLGGGEQTHQIQYSIKQGHFQSDWKWERAAKWREYDITLGSEHKLNQLLGSSLDNSYRLRVATGINKKFLPLVVSVGEKKHI